MRNTITDSTANSNKIVYLNRWALKQAKISENRDRNEFQQKFINHKNSVVKIINNTFKKIKSTKED